MQYSAQNYSSTHKINRNKNNPLHSTLTFTAQQISPLTTEGALSERPFGRSFVDKLLAALEYVDGKQAAGVKEA